MNGHVKIDPQPQPSASGWEIHEKDTAGKWFRPRTGAPYPLFSHPAGYVSFYCTIHRCWEWKVPEGEANVHRAYMIAVEKSIKPLANMARLMGFGESFREAMDALGACLEACDAHSLMCAGVGIETEGSQLYPEALEVFRKHYDPREKK